MDMEAARGAFVQEARELLEEMERALLEMEGQGVNDEAVNAVFRAAHTIKGSAGLFGLDPVVHFTHDLESVLDEVRGGRLAVDPPSIALYLLCRDHLGLLIDAVEEGSDVAVVSGEEGTSLRARLSELLGKKVAAPASAPMSLSKALAELPPLEPKVEVLPGESVANDCWHISLRLNRDILKSGLDPLSFFRYLGKLGRVVSVETLQDSLPEASEMDPELLYLGFEIQLESDADKSAIEGVFDFVSEGSLIQILPPKSKIAQYLSLIESLPEPVDRLGEILVSCHALTAKELAAALELQHHSQENDAGKLPIGQILVEKSSAPPVVVAAALSKQQASREHRTQENRHLKVDVTKLDALINLVGELVIASATARNAAVKEVAKESEEAIGNLTTLVEGIRDAALALRMVPVGEVFQRFPRVVHDLSHDLGKKIELVITGAETELDKSMVEKLTDPLTHIVRNSLDHGIESVEARVAAGKDETGTINLNAFHDAGSIVIEVIDDGAGMDRQRIRQKAVEKGLVATDQVLTDNEILRLIFEPGFSTSDVVTDLSGRGVGMDVVKRNIEALRGEVDVESEEGQGSTIRIRLPLTLAIIDGFQVRVGDSSYVVPLDLVQECSDLVKSDVQRNIVRLREEALPFLRLREVFHVAGKAPARESLLVAQYGQSRVGLVVDQLVGELQAVIKPLGAMFHNVRALGGTTILGDGSVALILDIPHLSQIAISLRNEGTEKTTALAKAA